MVARDIIAEDPVGLLTPRERECLRLVDQHLSSKQIARHAESRTIVERPRQFYGRSVRRC